MALKTFSQEHGHSTRTKPKIAVALIVLLLVLEAPAFSSATFSDMELSLAPGRSLSELKDEPTTLAIDLKHAFHVDSPHGQLDLTSSQKLYLLVESSKHRVSYFSRSLSGNAGTVAAGKTFVSPVQPETNVLSYTMQITLGTPPSTKHVSLDTGSDLVWVQCEPCKDCFNQSDPIFKPANSSSYTNISCTETLCQTLGQGSHICTSTASCEYGYAYGDGSTTVGILAEENFTLTSESGSKSVFPLAFGCGLDNEPGQPGLFNDTEGIVGMGRGALSLISQLGTNLVPVFSYCLVDIAVARNKTSLLLLGSAGNSTLAYTPLLLNSLLPSFYFVNLTGITVNGQAVKFPPGTFQTQSDGRGGTLLDSGTTLTYIVAAGYAPLIEMLSPLITYPLLNATEIGLDFCYDISGVPNPSFPEVVFQFQNLEVKLSESNLFLLSDDTACLVVQNATAQLSSINIYGNLMQQNFHVAYDVANNRVGFAPTTC